MHDTETREKARAYDDMRDSSLFPHLNVSADGVIQWINNAGLEYFQCTFAEITGCTFMEITPEPDRSLDVMNAIAVREGRLPRYPLPKQYRPPWLDFPIYGVVMVRKYPVGDGAFSHYTVEILPCDRAEYQRLKKVVLKESFGSLRSFLLWTGGLSWKELRGMGVWIVLSVAFVRYVPEAVQISLKEWLAFLERLWR